MNDQMCSSEAKVKVGGPAGPDSAIGHDMQPKGVHQRQILVMEAAKNLGGVEQIFGGQGDDTKRAHVVDDREKLQRSGSVEASQEPSVPLGDDEWRRDKPGRSCESLRKRKWCESDLSRKEMRADVST